MCDGWSKGILVFCFDTNLRDETHEWDQTEQTPFCLSLNTFQSHHPDKFQTTNLTKIKRYASKTLLKTISLLSNKINEGPKVCDDKKLITTCLTVPGETKVIPGLCCIDKVVNEVKTNHLYVFEQVLT